MTENPNPGQPQSRTAPGRLEAHDTDSEEEHFNLKKVMMCLVLPICMNVSLLFVWDPPCHYVVMKVDTKV